MRSFMNSLLIFLLSIVALSGCKIPESEIEEAFTPAPIEDPSDDLVNSELCHSQTTIQPEAELTNKIDILFVVDTSGSLDTERKQIAEGIDSFVAALPEFVDYQIAVTLAHGDKSQYSGKFYAKDPGFEVLKSSELSLAEIRNKLSRTMSSPKTDGDTDGGEVGIYSLYKAITDNLELNQSKGFFRNDAALAVVFVADENDICSLDDYPVGVTPVYDPNKKEPSAFNKYCKGLNNADVVNKLKEVQKGDPLLISGIIYTDTETVPNGGENEVGYGYLEMININNGIAVDLANGDYENSLNQIGFLAVKRLNLITEFTLEQELVDESSIKVFVDRERVDHLYRADVHEVQISEEDAGGEKSTVYIKYCSPASNPAVITNIKVPEFNSVSLFVTWDTDVPSTSYVRLVDVVTGEVFESEHYSNLETAHSVEASGLKANTLYEIIVISETQDGVQSQGGPIFMRTSR